MTGLEIGELESKEASFWEGVVGKIIWFVGDVVGPTARVFGEGDRSPADGQGEVGVAKGMASTTERRGLEVGSLTRIVDILVRVEREHSPGKGEGRLIVDFDGIVSRRGGKIGERNLGLAGFDGLGQDGLVLRVLDREGGSGFFTCETTK